ncbi:hypothetical protein [Yersinia alsatica]|uniref:hypothetical protein n=1 Tax=Yersinia alsatica TaxID=2890317 RepID=UPI00119F7014|nr:hypothetical protein [Yersinia alsatica]
MTPEAFINKHIVAALVTDGVPEPVARGGADVGVEHYHKLAQATKKGHCFDDCLREARLWVQFHLSKQERKTGKRRGKESPQLGLYP